MLSMIRRLGRPNEIRLEDDLATVCHKLGLSAASTDLEVSQAAAKLYGYDSQEFTNVSAIIMRQARYRSLSIGYAA